MFWISIRKEYPVISATAVKILLQFSVYFSLTNIKSKERNRLLSVEEELQVCWSKIRPRIQDLCKKKQVQVSH
jgi:hypothetical protein